MKQIFSLLSLLFVFSLAFTCAAAPAASANADPEILSTKGGKRNYTGVLPAKVKTIAVITPGSYPNPKTANSGIRLLRKAGYKVKVFPNVFVKPAGVEKNRYLSSPVAVRVKDFEAAWNDPEIDMIICARGGIGTEDLVANVNWAKLPRRPELYVQGYSDVTMLLSALSAKGYGRPIAGANITSLPGLAPAIIPEMKKMYHGQPTKPLKLTALVPGDCSGKVIAGLLSRLVRVTKANYGLETKGKILFIECVKSSPERIQSDLDFLLKNKFFDGAAGVVFGHFLRSGNKAVIDKILKEFSAKLKIPVYKGYPFGHHSRHMAIDFARTATIKNGVIVFP